MPLAELEFLGGRERQFPLPHLVAHEMAHVFGTWATSPGNSDTEDRLLLKADILRKKILPNT